MLKQAILLFSLVSMPAFAEWTAHVDYGRGTHAGEEDCREVGPSHPEYPNYNATRCLITVNAVFVGLAVRVGGQRVAHLSKHATDRLPHPCDASEDEDQGPAVVKVNSARLWAMVRDTYHHRDGQMAQVTFDVRRDLIRRNQDTGRLETHHQQCRGIVGISF